MITSKIEHGITETYNTIYAHISFDQTLYNLYRINILNSQSIRKNATKKDIVNHLYNGKWLSSISYLKDYVLFETLCNVSIFDVVVLERDKYEVSVRATYIENLSAMIMVFKFVVYCEPKNSDKMSFELSNVQYLKNNRSLVDKNFIIIKNPDLFKDNKEITVIKKKVLFKTEGKKKYYLRIKLVFHNKCVVCATSNMIIETRSLFNRLREKTVTKQFPVYFLSEQRDRDISTFANLYANTIVSFYNITSIDKDGKTECNDNVFKFSFCVTYNKVFLYDSNVDLTIDEAIRIR